MSRNDSPEREQNSGSSVKQEGPRSPDIKNIKKSMSFNKSPKDEDEVMEAVPEGKEV